MTDFYSLPVDAQAERMMGLARAALRFWDGDFDQLKLVKYRENAVFSAVRSDGKRVALRVHRHAYHSDAELRSELQWMQALDRAGVAAPEAIASAAGEEFVIVSTSDIPEPRQVDMLAWLDGQPVGAIELAQSADAETLAGTYFEAGRLAAQLHNQATSWQLPANFARHAWDAEGLVGEEPFWGRFWELALLSEEQVALIERARVQARRELEAFGQTPQNYSLIHADFVPENLLQENGRLKLIDFDDAGFGWHMFELATALYFHLDTDYYESIRNALFQGYRTERQLSTSDEAKLLLFLFLRSTTYLGWVHTRSETETAQELGPMIVERTCALADEYLRETGSL